MSYLKASAGAPTEVAVRVPEKMICQLVYRQVRTHQFVVTTPEGIEFVLVDGLAAALQQFSILRQIFGLTGATKAIAKVIAGRLFYFVRQDDQALHTGWMTVSTCRYYRVKEGDVVIGPIWSAEACRGRGIGPFATQMAMNAMVQRGRSVFFIDTDHTNVACIRLIDKCAFTSPVATYLR